MKDDAVPFHEYFMFERRNYKATYQSTDKSIVLYYYSNDTWKSYQTNSGCIWIQDENSIFREKVITDFYSQFYALYETKNAIIMLCSKGETEQRFYTLTIEKKTRQINLVQVSEKQLHEKDTELADKSQSNIQIYHELFFNPSIKQVQLKQ
ncbi:MAG: hypothetical protein ACRCYO_17965 [Bacteroidia bacterium]